MSYGMTGHIGIAKETTWGTAVAAADYLYALDENVTQEIERYEVSNIYGGLYEPDDIDGVRRVAGDITLPGYPSSLGYMLNSALGVQSVTEILSGTALWTATFTPLNSDNSSNCPVPSYTFEIYRDVTSSQQYAGMAVSALTLSVAPNQDVRLSASLIGKTATNIQKTSPSYTNSPTEPFAFETCSLSIGGSANADFESLEITFDNQLEGVHTLNSSTDVSKIRRTGSQTVRISGTVAFGNITEYENFRNQTEQRIVAAFTRADSFALTVDIPRMVYSSFPLGMGGRERLTVGFEGIGRYSTDSSYAIRADLTSTTSYY